MIQIVIATPQKHADTGIVGTVYPFGTDEPFSIEVRAGCVDLVGSAMLPSQYARNMAKALYIAADLAETDYESIQQRKQG